MRLSISLCFILVLALLLSPVKCCTPFYDEVSNQQLRYLGFQQRGLSRYFTTPFFENFLSDFYTYAQHQHKGADLSTLCLTITDLQDFYGNVHDHSAIDRELADLRISFPNLPYLSMDTGRFMPPKDKRLEDASDKWLNNTYDKLAKGDVKAAANLPKTADVIFDPRKQANLDTYVAHSSHAPMMPALRLLRIVTGMVITLELAEVSRMHSIQLLRHAVAWLSSVFRGLQIDGCSLQVPVLFTPFYEEEFERLMEYGLHKIPEVTEYDVAKLLGYELVPYCELDAWGKLEVLRWKNGKFTDIWTIEQVIFEPKFLSRAAQRIGFRKFDAANYPPYDPTVDGMDAWEMESASSTAREVVDSGVVESEQTMNTTVRPSGTCLAPHFEHVPRPGVSWDQKCCATICCNSVLMMQASLSLYDCCDECNQAFCRTDGQLSTLAMVHLQPYGGDPGGYVGVSL